MRRAKHNAYLIKAAEIDAAIRPVLSFGDRKITIGNAGHQCSGSCSPLHFYYQFPALRRQKVANDRMEELGVSLKRRVSNMGLGLPNFNFIFQSKGISALCAVPEELWRLF